MKVPGCVWFIRDESQLESEVKQTMKSAESVERLQDVKDLLLMSWGLSTVVLLVQSRFYLRCLLRTNPQFEN